MRTYSTLKAAQCAAFFLSINGQDATIVVASTVLDTEQGVYRPIAWTVTVEARQ